MRAASPVETSRGYVGPERDDAVDLRLDSNLPVADGTACRAAWDRMAPLAEASLAEYPDVTPLRAALAMQYGVDQGRILVTAGADEALDRVMRACVAPNDRVVIPVPTFSMIERYAQRRACAHRSRGLARGPISRRRSLQFDSTRDADGGRRLPQQPDGSLGVTRGAGVARRPSRPGLHRAARRRIRRIRSNALGRTGT